MGTVPVEPDGSAYLELPALRSFFFVALDENDLSVKRMQSFLTVQPGETTSCVGCHEQRTQAPRPTADLRWRQCAARPAGSSPSPMSRRASISRATSSRSSTALCVDCHGYEKTAAAARAPGGSSSPATTGRCSATATYMMTIAGLFSDGRNRPRSNYAPRTLGSSASRVLTMLDGSHYGVQATPRQKKMLRLWIEVGAAYPGTYAALGCGMIGGYAENGLIKYRLRTGPPPGRGRR